MIVLSTLLLPAMIVRFYQGWFQMLLIDLPLFLASSCSISGFYLASQRALYPKTLETHHLYLPFVMAVGIGLSVRNAKAVLEALFGMQSEFVRTPKFSIEGQGGHLAQKALSQSRRMDAVYRIVPGLLLRRYDRVRHSNENYATVPFLLLFVWGYLYTGLMSLGQVYIERMRMRARVRLTERRPPRRQERRVSRHSPNEQAPMGATIREVGAQIDSPVAQW